MNFYIQIVNGNPYEHPISEVNMKRAFPDEDLNNLSSNFARFIRIEPPEPSVYQVYEGVNYVWEGSVVKDSHIIRDMTDQEKTAKKNAVKTYWASHGFASWTFNEDSGVFDPPVPFPTDGNFYNWDEATTSWVEVTDA